MTHKLFEFNGNEILDSDNIAILKNHNKDVSRDIHQINTNIYDNSKKNNPKPSIKNVQKYNDTISGNQIGHPIENFNLNKYKNSENKNYTNNDESINYNKCDNDNKPNNNETIYFDVYFRKIIISEENIIYNIIFYDVTDLISAKLKILGENNKKQRLFAKMAHEFKTPLTSIISLISILKDNIEPSPSHSSFKIYCERNFKINKDTNNTLDLIQNLSQHVIFLISDIINYSNMDKINEMKFENNKIDFKEISRFCFDILRSLLYCNFSKLKKLKLN